MIDYKTAPYAALLLRVGSGVLFLVHAGAKIFVFGLPGTIKYFAFLGLPDWMAYSVFALEGLGGLALILGIYARLVAIPLVIELLGTIVSVHWGIGLLSSNKGAGWEFPAIWIVALLAMVLLGEGPFALRPTPTLRK